MGKIQWLIFYTVMATFVAACGGGGDGGAQSCDIVANAQGPAFMKVVNNLGTGLQWQLSGYAFGADMKPGECTIFGLSASQHTVSFQQCNIGDAACTSTFGATVQKVFAVANGETYTFEVNASLFQ